MALYGTVPPFLDPEIPIEYPRKLSDTGWWYTCPSEKYDFVSWDDETPN